ncbi:SGF29 tudor-like domain-containing protein [Phascolomyces articulosus]|uniref:SGF29 tudor-like domain-containing protein n=1 Tax=Phascolomyces articulosus TaxID=60185 RepID=A0AAD5KC57_9FUNG|nr:SGF29 tudor-like domain-containing protein [Phascolomyces articulosus]
MDRKSRTSRSASLEDTNEELSLWKQICTSLVKLDNIQKETETVLNDINKIHLGVNFDEGISMSISQKLKQYYQNGIDLSSSEARTISDIIEKVSVLIALREASENTNEQKRKKRKTEADELKSSNSSPSGTSAKKSKNNNNDIILPGTSVAAKQPKQKDKNEEWILAVVINFQADKNRYHVEDVDQDEFGQKQRYFIPPRNVIPVPDGRDIRNVPEIGTGQDVLALYPGTTCFYKATVILPPSKNKDITYRVQFEDDNNEYKDVQRDHVLEMPKSLYV